MTTTVVALRDRAPQPKQAATEFTFSKTTIRKAVERTGDAKGIEFRDEGCRGLVLRKQTRDWTFGIKRKISGKVRRATLCRWTGREDIAEVRKDAERIMSAMKEGTYVSPKDAAAQAEQAQAQDAERYTLVSMTIQNVVALHAQVNPQLRASTLESYRYSVQDLTEGHPTQLANLTPQMMREA